MTVMTSKIIWSVVVVMVCAMFQPMAARGQSFDVPPGFVVDLVPADPEVTTIRPILSVRPEEGTFADLSSLTLAEIMEPVPDADEWLESRLALEPGSEQEWEQFLNSPDSPFGDPLFDSFRSFLPKLQGSLESLGRTPLSICTEPTTPPGVDDQTRELSCSLNAGPFNRYIIYRVHRVGEQNFSVRIDSFNERRLRHLIAIANSFSMSR
jgi:hypothetical protein